MQEKTNFDEKYKVSLLVAAYNIEPYIRQCIESIVEQTYKNIEIIIVDDCSTDKTGIVCDELAAKDDRIICIHHDSNLKLPSTRNTGLDRATGDFIVFVDGDDWLATDYVEYMLDLIIKTEADMALSDSNFTTRDLSQTESDRVEIWSPERATSDFLYSRLSIGAWNKIYNRDFIEKNHLRFKTDLFTAEGYRFISDCAQRANRIAVGHKRVYYYRLNNPNSATTFPDIRQGTGALYALEGIERDLIIRTKSVMDSLNHHRWSNYFYTLRLIIQTGDIEKEKQLYRKCIRYIRRHGIIVALQADGFKPKLRILATTVCPVLMCNYDIKKLTEGLRKDIENSFGGGT